MRRPSNAPTPWPVSARAATRSAGPRRASALDQRRRRRFAGGAQAAGLGPGRPWPTRQERSAAQADHAAEAPGPAGPAALARAAPEPARRRLPGHDGPGTPTTVPPTSALPTTTAPTSGSPTATGTSTQPFDRPAPAVIPNAVDLPLKPGTSTVVDKRVRTPAILPRPDIVLLVDGTASMQPSIDDVRKDIRHHHRQGAGEPARFAARREPRSGTRRPTRSGCSSCCQPLTYDLDAAERGVGKL
ncbi:hypothetical protein ACU686_25895 [Yinghuangia aomiensis]